MERWMGSGKTNKVAKGSVKGEMKRRRNNSLQRFKKKKKRRR